MNRLEKALANKINYFKSSQMNISSSEMDNGKL